MRFDFMRFMTMTFSTVCAAGLLAANGFAQTAIKSVEASSRANFIVVAGTVAPAEEVVVRAQLPGTIEYLIGEEGDIVYQGSTMISVSTESLAAMQRQLQARVSQMQSALENAQVQYQRELHSPKSESAQNMPGMMMPSMMDQMFMRQFADAMGYGDSGVARHADLFNQSANVNQANANLQQAQYALEEIKTKLEDAHSKAPFSGVITHKHVSKGEVVQPGTPLLTLADISVLQVHADVPVRLVGSLQRGQKLMAKLDTLDAPITVAVSHIYPVANVANHTVKVEFNLPSGVAAGPGLYAEVQIPDTKSKHAPMPLIDKGAVVSRGSLPSVYVLDHENKARLRVVRLGSEVGDKVTVLSGLRVGERIVVNPPISLSAGQEVKNFAQ